MPPLPSVPNVLAVQLGWSAGADTTIHSGLFFRYSGGPPTTTDATALSADVYGHASSFNVLYDETTFLDGVVVTDLSSAGAAQGEHAQTTAGTRSGGPLPGAACALVAYLIQRRYRGGKPRTYFPFGTDADLSSRQNWNASFTTAVDSALSTFFAGVIGTVEGTTTITDHVNVSYYEGFTVVTSPTTGRARNVPKRRTVPVVDVIQSYSTKPNVASQRRRNR